MVCKKNKKILILAQAPFSPQEGGVERYISEQAHYLKRQGYQVVIGYFNNYFLNKLFPRTLLNLVFLRSTINKFIKRNSFDNILIHHPLVGYIYYKYFDKPAVYFFHASYYQELLDENKKNKLFVHFVYQREKFTLQKAEKIILLSDFSKRILIKTYPHIDQQKIIKIPGGVDLRKFQYKAKLADQQIRLFTVRRLVPRMGLENLIRAIKILQKKYPKLLLLIAGKGFLKQKLQKYIYQMKLEQNIRLLGLIADEQLVSHYQQADLFVLPTLSYEGFGLVTLEALACGTPVMATPIGATPEILRDLDKRLLFKDSSAASIAQGIEWFIKNKKLHKRLSEKGLKLVRNKYSWDRIIKLIEKEL